MRNVVAIIRRSTASSLLLFLCFFLWASSFFVTYLRVVGDSMKPAFSTGSILVCTKTADVEKLRYGDCVVAHIPYSGEDLTVTKRIVGLPGEGRNHSKRPEHSVFPNKAAFKEILLARA